MVVAASSPGDLTLFLRLQNRLSRVVTDPFPWLLNSLLNRRCVPQQTHRLNNNRSGQMVKKKKIIIINKKTPSSICMSNFAPLPHPPQAFSRVLVFLSIWPRPRGHAIELTVLLKVSGVSTIEFKMGGTERCIEKSRPFKTRTSGPAGQRHRAVSTWWTSAHGSLFPFSVSTGCIDLTALCSLRSRLKMDPGVLS